MFWHLTHDWVIKIWRGAPSFTLLSTPLQSNSNPRRVIRSTEPRVNRSRVFAREMQTVATFKFYELSSFSISFNNNPGHNQNQYHKTTQSGGDRGG